MTKEINMRSSPDADEAEALAAIGWTPTPDDSACPDSSLLLAAEEGALDDAIAERMRAHVKSCATCQQLMKDLALVLDEAPTEAETPRIRSRIDAGRSTRPAHPYIWLGGLAAAAAVTWFLFVPRGTSAPPAPDTQLARATPPPVPTVFVVDRPAIPPGDVDLTVRGEATKRVSLEDQIAIALDTADKGDAAAAGSILTGIVKDNPSSRIAALALGAIQLRANQNAEAVTALERARSLKGDAATGDEVDWFYSIALVRTGNKDRARVLLDGVCKHGGPRGAKACAGVAEIDRNTSAR